MVMADHSSNPLKRHWVTKVSCGTMEVQRLSKMAVVERIRCPHRFRLVDNGQVVGHYHSREDVDGLLRNKTSSTYDEELLRRWMKLPASLDTPRQTPHGTSQIQTPRTAEADGPSQQPSPRSGEAQPKPSSSSPAVKTSRSGSKPAPETSESSPRGVQAPKVTLSTEERAARRASLWKPPTPEQEPVATMEAVHAWSYDYATNQWSRKDMVVRIAPQTFAEGGMRGAYKMVVVGPAGEKPFVAKKFNEFTETQMIAPPIESFGGQDPDKVVQKPWVMQTLNRQPDCDLEKKIADSVFKDDQGVTTREFLTWHRRLKLFKVDVEMQGFCQTYAKEFNKLRPPKLVEFLEAFIIVCYQRPDNTIYACEPMIAGEYVKHSNNSGMVQDTRNTPQAFSHFTHWFSKGQHVIVDIQGVGDTYTDPQVHSVEGRFGMGNLGQDGIDSFFKTHRCNLICKGLGFMPETTTVRSIKLEEGTRYVY